jgi:hypothetical protein
MCTPAALETLLRGTLRKVGVDCVAIAVDASSFSGGGDPVDCTRIPTRTRIAEAIHEARLAIQYATDGTPLPLDPSCTGIQLETLLNTVLVPSDTANVSLVDTLVIVGASDCPDTCEDDAVGLAERFAGSVRLIEEDGTTRLVAVEALSGTPLDCEDMTPTETLLRSAFVRQSDGGWAMRILIEA